MRRAVRAAGTHILCAEAGVVGVHAVLRAAIVGGNAAVPIAERRCCCQPPRAAQCRQREGGHSHCCGAWPPLGQRSPALLCLLLLLLPLPELHGCEGGSVCILAALKLLAVHKWAGRQAAWRPDSCRCNTAAGVTAPQQPCWDAGLGAPPLTLSLTATTRAQRSSSRLLLYTASRQCAVAVRRLQLGRAAQKIPSPDIFLHMAHYLSGAVLGAFARCAAQQGSSRALGTWFASFPELETACMQSSICLMRPWVPERPQSCARV